MRETSEAELTEAQYELSDLIRDLLEANQSVAWTPSAIARKAHTATDQAGTVLRWLVAHHMALAAGSGAWTKYSHRPLHTPIQHDHEES